MLDKTNTILELKENAETIQKYQDEIEGVAKILETPENLDTLTIEERKELLKKRRSQLILKRDEFYMNSNLHEKKSEKNTKKIKEEESLIPKKIEALYVDKKEIMANFFKTTNSFGAHLFTFLEVPNLPSTNNGTEQMFGGVRTKLRRITGRQNNHSTIYTHGEYIALTLNVESHEQLVQRISGVAYEDYCAERKCHEKTIAHLKVERQLSKDTNKFFQGLESEWCSLNN